MKNKQLITTCLVGVACALIAAFGTTVYFNCKDKEEEPIVEEAIKEKEVAEPLVEEVVKEEPEEQPTLQKAKANTTKNKKNIPQVEEVVEEKEETKTATTKKSGAETTTANADTSKTTTNNNAAPQPTPEAVSNIPAQPSEPTQEVVQNTPTQPSEPAPTQPTQPSNPAPTQPTVIESSIPADGPLFNGDWIVDPTNPAVGDAIVDDFMKDFVQNH